MNAAWLFVALLSAQAGAQSSEELFMKLYDVARSPRCVNCHSPYEMPLQTDASTPHNMNIKRGLEQVGMACATCHSDSGFNQVNHPPHAVGWRMPSTAKAMYKSMTPDYLCQLWKSDRNAVEDGPKKGHRRTLQELLTHVDEDPLVNWAFEPGVGRTPASQTLSHADFVKTFAQWVNSGAACPQSK